MEEKEGDKKRPRGEKARDEAGLDSKESSEVIICRGEERRGSECRESMWKRREEGECSVE